MRCIGFVRKLQEATGVDWSFLYPVLSKIDSGRRLLQISFRKTLISKERILRKKMFFPLACKSLSCLKGFGVWRRCLMTGKLQTCQARMGMWGNRGWADWKDNLERNAKPWDRTSPWNWAAPAWWGVHHPQTTTWGEQSAVKAFLSWVLHGQKS